MRVAIHQPQYIPWIPYFSKIVQSDVFVLLEDVQYQKNGVQNRNSILTPNGPSLLTVPVKGSFGERINEVHIANTATLGKHIKSIEQSYRKAPYFLDVMNHILIHLGHQHSNLSNLNCEIIRSIANYLDLKTKILSSVDIDKSGEKGELVLSICETLGANEYITGKGALSYMDPKAFSAKNINITLMNYRLDPYPQLHSKGVFVSELSIIDLLMNEGPNSIRYL